MSRTGTTSLPAAVKLELLVESGVVSLEKLARLWQDCEELTAISVNILNREDSLILPLSLFLFEWLALDVVGRTVARVSIEEQMASYQAARAVTKRNSESVSSRGRSAKKSAKNSAVKKAETKK